jgi:CheY-like chemotaxis protein
MLDLKGMQILIVEDEFLLANDMARQFAKAGAKVLGPSVTVDEARLHVEKADAAILDIHVNGELVFPIADELARRRVPFVFFTGSENTKIPTRFHFVRKLRKPLSPEQLARELIGRPAADSHVEALLPGLRVAARLRVADTERADALVENTLRRAIDEIASRPAGVSLEDWLHDLLDDVHDETKPYGREPESRNW